MRSHALALRSLQMCCLLSVPLVSSCSLNSNGDYSVTVPWTINGMVPDQGLCQEQHIAKARFVVTSAAGKPLKTLEADCASLVTLSDNNEYGGFTTTRAFDWDKSYDYTLTLVDASGNPVSTPGQGSFSVPFDNAEIYELGFLDYLNPAGTVAGFSAEWSVRSNPDVAAACLADRISKVQIWVASGLDDMLVDATKVAEANCSDGSFVSSGKVLATGNYQFQYVAVSANGNEVQAGAAISIQVDGTKDIALPREMFLSN